MDVAVREDHGMNLEVVKDYYGKVLKPRI